MEVHPSAQALPTSTETPLHKGKFLHVKTFRSPVGLSHPVITLFNLLALIPLLLGHLPWFAVLQAPASSPPLHEFPLTFLVPDSSLGLSRVLYGFCLKMDITVAVFRPCSAPPHLGVDAPPPCPYLMALGLIFSWRERAERMGRCLTPEFPSLQSA